MIKATVFASLIILSMAPDAHANPAAELTAAEETMHFCWQTRWQLRNFRGPRDAAYQQRLQEMRRLCTRAWYLSQESMAQGNIPFNGNPRPQAYPFDPPLSWFTTPPQPPGQR